MEGPGLTTTRTKKRNEKITKAKQEELERDWRDRNRRLVGMGIKKDTFEQFLEWVYGRGAKTKTSKEVLTSKNASPPRIGISIDHSSSRTILAPRTSNGIEAKKVVANSEISPKQTHGPIWVKGPTSSKPSPVYTGSKVIGIGQMHKSNAVPIFSDEEAVDISRMRR
jgi:hypothetical protein